MQRRRINKNGDQITPLNIEITSNEVDILTEAKEKFNYSKTNCIKHALKAWRDTGYKKY